ncbi:MAG TPA: ScpA family protein [Hyphomicrobiaceae bacterium]|nr:ScpA family protein [Hyphomicrobiaceae bacterium]
MSRLETDQGWDAAPEAERLRAGQGLRVDIDGFEGPLDLLLALARTHKIDLAKISMLALADQYLAFVAEARRLNLELAADYLVMAAWLAFLKSRLLLPRDGDKPEEPSGEELAARLAFRLRRLEAMRNAVAALMTRKLLGRDVFPRGMPEAMRTIRETTYTAQIYDLLKAYAEQRQRTAKRVHVVEARKAYSIKEARERLEAMLGERPGEWQELDLLIEKFLNGVDMVRSVLASSFGASLEMAREGLIELRQEGPFAPIYMRRKVAGAAWERVS